MGGETERRQDQYIQNDAKALYKDIKGYQGMLRNYDMLDEVINKSPAIKKQLKGDKFSLDAYNRGELDFPGVNLPILGRLTFFSEEAKDINKNILTRRYIRSTEVQ